MKNLNIYIGTIKECLNPEAYKKDGDYTYVPEFQISTSCSRLKTGYARPNTKVINEHAILIAQKQHFYEFKLSNSFIDNLKIILDLGNHINTKPEHANELFCPEESLIPFYDEQPKKFSFRKLQNDVLSDPRIKTRIKH